MNETDLLNRHPVELPAGTPTLTPDAVEKMLPLVPGWDLADEGKGLHRRQRFADFVSAIAFVNRVAELAEVEQHHPDIHVTGYRWLDLDLSTHSIGGLSDNDFIMAAKINRLFDEAA
ncbi:MAG: 4a-hydroxytetrahydrobiopterin dehydratase [Dehalococcoidia bacterium]|nr:4a-hydroxytetrahydrobiopterin dehydratase [Dehalococcoidia bacterium]